MEQYLLHITVGFLMAFIGLMAPGLLTMTALKTAVERGPEEGRKFARGVMIPILVQAHIALLGAHYLLQHPVILVRLSQAAILLFLVLAWLFYRQARKGYRESSVSRYNIKNSFYYGIFISAINPMAIPFYLTYSSLLEYKGIIRFEQPYITLFVLGAALGAYAILSIYATYARRIIGRIAFLSQNFYYILSFVAAFLALASVVGNIIKYHSAS